MGKRVVGGQDGLADRQQDDTRQHPQREFLSDEEIAHDDQRQVESHDGQGEVYMIDFVQQQ